ncbi:unnamed protein product [Blepharisma stoltei]|uniref:C2 domain-containing protein n=1 Tax=Blepharisma stoltei TaxID=1481888 RepID=A0AAU9JVX4_9CILI|nr:unnamed protein product [Blepharisma stoltei]
MGGCASRITQSELEQHKRDYNSKNDANFRSIPFEQTIDQAIKEDQSIRGLEEKRKIYTRKEIEYKTKLENTPAGVPPIPELNIEIQKGINFYSQGLCITQGKPYVCVKIEPKGASFETFVSDIYKPYWYKLFQIKQSLHNFTSIHIRVYIKKNLRQDLLLGSIEIKLNDLEDQKVVDGWYNIDTKIQGFIESPALRIRVQLVHNERLLLQRMIENCREKLAAIQSVKEKIEATIKPSNEVPNELVPIDPLNI